MIYDWKSLGFLSTMKRINLTHEGNGGVIALAGTGLTDNASIRAWDVTREPSAE